MADLALTAAQVDPLFDTMVERYPYIAAETITKGQAVYFNSSGKIAVANATTATLASSTGIALTNAGAGYAVSVMYRGKVGGFTITQAYDAPIYLSDTAGVLSDTAGTVSKIMGYVTPLSDSDATKVLFINAR